MELASCILLNRPTHWQYEIENLKKDQRARKEKSETIKLIKRETKMLKNTKI